MKILKRHILTFAAFAAVCTSAVAQNSSSSSIMRRGNTDRNKQSQEKTELSERAKSFYEKGEISDADLQWMRVIYRQLDLQNPKNAALYYPEDLIDGQENLFRMMLRLVAEGKVPAYEYLDGREIFTDQYRLNIKDMLERYHINYTPAKGSTEKNPRYEIAEIDVPTTDVLAYYILERWEFDTRSNSMKTRVEAICPVYFETGDYGLESLKFPMFWVKLDALRPYLAQQYIFIDDDNNLAKYTYDDFFAMNMYDGDIYKTRNLMNKSMAQLYPDAEKLKHAQDSIQQRLDNFGKKLWVPSREEVIAAREAREAAAAGDTTALAPKGKTAIKDRDKAEDNKASSRSSRGRKSTKVKEPKAPKSSSSSSNAVRSVRKRK